MKPKRSLFVYTASAWLLVLCLGCNNAAIDQAKLYGAWEMEGLAGRVRGVTNHWFIFCKDGGFQTKDFNRDGSYFGQLGSWRFRGNLLHITMVSNYYEFSAPRGLPTPGLELKFSIVELSDSTMTCAVGLRFNKVSAGITQ